MLLEECRRPQPRGSAPAERSNDVAWRVVLVERPLMTAGSYQPGHYTLMTLT